MNHWYRNTGKKPNFCYFLNGNEVVEISIQNEAGEVVSKLKGTSDKGLNFIEWDLKQTVENEQKLVEAGNYSLRIEIDGKRFTKDFSVKKFSR